MELAHVEGDQFSAPVGENRKREHRSVETQQTRHVEGVLLADQDRIVDLELTCVIGNRLATIDRDPTLRGTAASTENDSSR